MVTITGWYIGVPWICFWWRHSLTFHHHHFGGEFPTGETYWVDAGERYRSCAYQEAPLNITQKCSRLLLVVGSFNPFEKKQSNQIGSLPQVGLFFFFFWRGGGWEMRQQKHPKKVHLSHAITPSIQKTKQFHSFINDISRKQMYIYIYIYLHINNSNRNFRPVCIL